MTQRVLVTGASGFVGRTLVSLLLNSGWQVRVLTRSRDNVLQHSWRHQVEISTGDLQHDAACRSAVHGVDAIVHLAGLAHVGATDNQHRQENFENTKNLARAANDAFVKRFVYISSCKARYPAHSAYGYYKQQSELHLLSLKSMMQVVCLRPGIIYGPGMQNNLTTLLRLLSRPQLPISVESRQTLSMISLDDCCRAIATALEHPAAPGQIWELTDGTRYTLTDLVHTIRAQLQLSPPALVLPQWLAGNALARMLAGLAATLPSLRKRGLGTSTFQALFEENYPVELAFAQATGAQPTTTLYAELPTLLASVARAQPAH